MDPVNAGIELWKMGGIAAVLLGIIVASGYLMFRFLTAQIRALGERLNQVQDRQVNEISVLVRECTVSNHAVVAACSGLKESHHQVVDALRVRPCLLETGPHQAVRTPLPH